MKKYRIIFITVLLIVFVLAGCTIEVSSTTKDKVNTVTVSNIDELLQAISPNTTIFVNDGVYNITTAAKYGKADASKYYSWNNYGYSYEYELQIDGIDNLTIIANGAQIVTEPRCAEVLSFINCDNLTLSGLTIGHTEAADACEGGVVKLDHCDNVKIDKCSLYGCGTIGVSAYSCNAVTLDDSDIYHCSIGGVSLSDCNTVSVEKCRIYDCGNNTEYSYGVGIFMLSGITSQVTVNGCEIFDNNTGSFLQNYGDGTGNVTFNNINLHNNHFSYLADAYGNYVMNSFSLNNNVIDSWFGPNPIEVSMDGKIVSSEDLDALWPEQTSSAGIGTVETSSKEINTDGTKIVHVSTTDEFLSAIDSNTTIYIDVPQLNLTDASDYGADASEEWYEPNFEGKKYAWSAVYDGYQLCIGYLDNLNIIGGEIITEPRYAHVLSFYGCSNIGLKELKLGHSPEQGECCGGVTYFYCCDNIIVESCDLYGCGIMGLWCEYTSEMNVQNTLIHDCNQQAGYFVNCLNTAFIDCTVENCPQPNFSLSNCSNFTWNNKLMAQECSFNA